MSAQDERPKRSTFFFKKKRGTEGLDQLTALFGVGVCSCVGEGTR